MKQMSSPSATQVSFIERRYLVFFRFGQHTVDSASQLDLARVARHLVNASSVTVVGSTDAIGPTNVNQQLAARRARAIIKTLQAAGLPDSVTVEKALPNRIGGDLSASAVLGSSSPSTVTARARHAEIIARVPAAEASHLVSVGGRRETGPN